jgi:DNA topoisomerase-1
MNLLIIESPGKQKTIQKYLGPKWKVVASMGHIRGLAHNIDFLTNNYEPSYEYLKNKSKAIKDLREHAKMSRDIYLGADSDFEGEQIAYSVCLLLKLNPDTAKRIVFTEITEEAIKKAISIPSTINMNRVHTQQCRAMLDIMIGFTMSPLLWKHVFYGLSAGRCQIPCLRLVVERENLLDRPDKQTQLKSETEWKLKTQWETQDGFQYNSTMETELEDEDSIINYMENTMNLINGIICDKKESKWSERAPPPLITSTLQQQASALFGCNPKNTMRIAQRLYEAGHITYMRTDKAVLSDDAKRDAMKWVTIHHGNEYVAYNKPKPNEAPQNQQGAHEAIRPTHMDVTTIEGDSYEKRIYQLIWRRAIQSVMSSASGNAIHIKTQVVNDENDFMWNSNWKHTTFEGWKRIGQVAILDHIDDENEPVDEWKEAEQLQIGDPVQWKCMKGEPKETQTKPRFTEATLVRELDKYGIGRPSTFASLLETIQEKNYVELRDIPPIEIEIHEYTMKPRTLPQCETKRKQRGGEKNKLHPTDLGRSVLHFMLAHFNDLFDYGFTSEMEKKLDTIQGDNWKGIVKDTWESYKDRYEVLLSSKKQSANAMGNVAGSVAGNVAGNVVNGNAKVHEFENKTEKVGKLKAIYTKNGPQLILERDGNGDGNPKTKSKKDIVFIGWKKGLAFDEMTEAFANEILSGWKPSVAGGGMRVGEWKGEAIQMKTGKFGDYLQCGSTSIPYKDGETIEEIVARFETKSSAIIGVYKEYVVKDGPYGPYIMKKNSTQIKTKKPLFVGIKEMERDAIQRLTEVEIAELYRVGAEAPKKKWRGFKKK